MTTIALVGIGNWGVNLLRVFDELAEVAYCCHTGSSANAEYVKTEYPHVELTTEYERLLTDEAVDAVVIATPIDTHAELAERALHDGKDVFVEKPLAHSLHAAQSVVETAEVTDSRVFVGYVFCYAPAIQALYRRVQDDPVRDITASWSKFGSFGSSIYANLVCHDVAIGEHLFALPFSEASVVSEVGVRTDADACTVCFNTEAGRSLTARYDRVADGTRKELHVVTKARRRYLFRDDRLFELDGDSYRDITPEKAVEPLRAEVDAFLDWVQGGPRPPTDGRFGVRVNRSLSWL